MDGFHFGVRYDCPALVADAAENRAAIDLRRRREHRAAEKDPEDQHADTTREPQHPRHH